jgi:hypothetical protein
LLSVLCKKRIHRLDVKHLVSNGGDHRIFGINRRESLADFTWCMTALDWGHSIEETANHLMQVSSKARESGERYAVLTASNAAAAVERKGQGHARG